MKIKHIICADLGNNSSTVYRKPKKNVKFKWKCGISLMFVVLRDI